MKILVLNGPNLNLLGMREKDIYVNETLQDVEHKLKEIAEEVNAVISFYQSNAAVSYTHLTLPTTPYV